MESHSANVRRLVDEFRSRLGDSRIDIGGMRRVWENLLRQVEADATSHLDLAAVLQQQLSRPTLEASFHRKLQSRKVSFLAHVTKQDIYDVCFYVKRVNNFDNKFTAQFVILFPSNFNK